MDKNETEMLAYEIADYAAQIDIESFCCGIGPWWNVCKTDDEEAAWRVERAVLYLELRGKLERHPDTPELVQIRAVTSAD